MSERDAITVGEAAEQAGNYLDASAAYSAALTDDDESVVADAQFHLGRVSWRQGRYDDAVSHYEAARQIAMRRDDDELRARVENGIGAVHHGRGAYAQSRASYGVALDLAKDETQRGRILLNLGAVANIEGDFESARAHYTKSRAVFQRTGHKRGEASALNNLGMLNADEGRWVDADDAYRRCLELLESLKDRHGVASVLLNRSELDCARGESTAAIASCDLALSIYTDVGDDAGRAEALRWRGHALQQLARFAEAERALTDALRIAKRLQIDPLEAEITQDLAEAAAQRAQADHGE
ncbi:MAG TPA: tetratricopeptide repeat protein [Gemmatimonadaceae bacterium]